MIDIKHDHSFNPSRTTNYIRGDNNTEKNIRKRSIIFLTDVCNTYFRKYYLSVISRTNSFIIRALYASGIFEGKVRSIWQQPTLSP